MRSTNAAGRSRQSPGISSTTARPSRLLERQTGSRCAGAAAPDPLAPFVDYLKERFADDPHVWASALHDEVRRLGYPLSYPSFVRQLRKAGLRPHCEACRGVKGRDTIEIDHPAGEEIQWDWFERRNAPWGGTAYVLLGTLPHSGRVRGVLSEKMDHAHLVAALDEVMRKLGGTARTWRTDRLSTVITPGTRDVQVSFAPVAKHYGAVVEPCPPRRGNRKGAVESSVRFVSGRWWRTMSDKTPEDAQRSLDLFCSTTAEERERRFSDGTRTTVRVLADAEPLLTLPPVPFPATIEVERTVADNATLSYRAIATRSRRARPNDVARPPADREPDDRRRLAVRSDPRHASDCPRRVGSARAQSRASRSARTRRFVGVHDGSAVRQEGQPAAR